MQYHTQLQALMFCVFHTTKNINSLEHVKHRAACWASGGRWNPCSYSWSKSSDECITELKWPSIHQRHVYFSICQVMTFYIVTTLLATSSYPMLLLDHILCLFNLFNLLSIPIVIVFLLTAHSYGTLCLMVSSGLNSLALSPSSLPFDSFYCCNWLLCVCVYCIYVIVHIIL